jgi:hypothetical protein
MGKEGMDMKLIIKNAMQKKLNDLKRPSNLHFLQNHLYAAFGLFQIKNRLSKSKNN